MNLHEYQAKVLLRSLNISAPEGLPAFSVEEAMAAAVKLGGDRWVVKAQIHAGGRGKGGGVKIANNKKELKEHVEAILGMTLVTPQTGKQGKLVRRLYIEKPADIDKEFYFSMVIDRTTSLPTCIISTEGGMNIEEVAAETPEKILTMSISPITGVQPYHARRMAQLLGLSKGASKQAAQMLKQLYTLFVEKDLSLLEINPLLLSKQDELICLDAKISLDDNALYRQSELAAQRDWDEEDPSEQEAGKYDLNFIKLEGEIGCMVNGAGLAMATMDIIKHYGGSPANFLDVGGGADKEKVSKAFQLLLADKAVRGILVNIFGGIMRCDTIAEGIVAAAKEMNLSIPLVVRLEGTNVEKGKEILKQSGLAITSADNLDQAAQKAVELIK